MNSLTIVTNKSRYEAGDTVSATALLELEDSVAVRSIYASFTAFELSDWEHGGGRDFIPHRERYVHASEEIVLLGTVPITGLQLVKDDITHLLDNHHEKLPPGSYEYPFSFLLPRSIPNSYESPWNSSIQYQICVTVDVPIAFDLVAEKRLQVNGHKEAPVWSDGDGTTMQVFQLPDDGFLALKIGLSKREYVVGEEITCNSRVRWSAKAEKPEISLELKQIERLIATGKQHTNESRMILSTHVFESFATGHTQKLEESFKVPLDLLPSLVGGKLISLSYEMVLKGKFSSNEDYEVALPIFIKTLD